MKAYIFESIACFVMLASPLAAQDKLKTASATPTPSETATPSVEPMIEAPPEEASDWKPGEDELKKLSEALLKVGLCNEGFYGKAFCAELHNKAATAPAGTPPLEAPAAAPTALAKPDEAATEYSNGF